MKKMKIKGDMGPNDETHVVQAAGVVVIKNEHYGVNLPLSLREALILSAVLSASALENEKAISSDELIIWEVE